MQQFHDKCNHHCDTVVIVPWKVIENSQVFCPRSKVMVVANHIECESIDSQLQSMSGTE